ncbi:tRNA guanosine(34) transglycosylase Tgt [Helicobacter aurati]|uniref:Queuine tRNA-ribosyltransferase n=1 Tax=Helicobacter aurati TaxID=137778 RepID=A0A3D8J8H1_9HELI|nr:tRNA guanosine(34) transglycosylase Tgt [Helicobacter aurati]RDU73475.1 tRNA guanosine(34) transglycosylase Tgt [Helicobacter aurati]
MQFIIEATQNKARACRFTLAHGVVETPIFMPVGTQGTLKGIDCVTANTILQTHLILANTYHLYLRPGIEVFLKAGGIHQFARFNGNYLTDSGGFQAFSMGTQAKTEDIGIAFRSHIDGSKHFFTPTKALEIQYAINSDIMMVLDDLAALPANRSRLLDSVTRTTHWAKQSIAYHNSQKNAKEIHNRLFAIMQGGVDYEMRKRSANELCTLDFDGYAIGGLAVGESQTEMYDCLDYALDFLPTNKPRYLMGVGTPQNLLECIERGVDMFDCVMPSRNARNACIFTSEGKIHIKSPSYKTDFSPLDSQCQCYTCKNYTRSYLHHLFRAKELSYHSLATIHNLFFYLQLMRESRKAILNGYWKEYKKNTLEKLSNH